MFHFLGSPGRQGHKKQCFHLKFKGRESYHFPISWMLFDASLRVSFEEPSPLLKNKLKTIKSICQLKTYIYIHQTYFHSNTYAVPPNAIQPKRGRGYLLVGDVPFFGVLFSPIFLVWCQKKAIIPGPVFNAR